ncbi:MAG TPA: hypothetical protein ENH29_08725, partial [Bacteroidetes bacterium]|nr:hypothetical protein [Bacteroidota bacterium]
MPCINYTAKCFAQNIPHAKILSIDVSAVRRLPGVAAVLTAADIPGSKTFGIVTKNQQVLVSDKARYLGDGIVLIAAETREIAGRALRHISVSYRQLPVLSSPD